MARFCSLVLVGASLLVVPGSKANSNARAPRPPDSTQAAAPSLQLPETIKVSLMHSRRPVSIGCTGRYSYASGGSAKRVELGRSSRLAIRAGRKGLMVGNKSFGSFQIAAADAGSYLTVNGRPYRGTLTLRMRRAGVIDVIEQVALEGYLNGVLPREVGFDWPEESLKAQAVISRTYVIANLGKSPGKGYDVSSDVFSQVYGGLQDEHPASSKAVEATRGEILVDDKGVPVLTFFHSSCGGRTEDPRYVWQDIQNPPEYLVSVKDSFCRDDPFYNWYFQISGDSLKRRLNRAGFRKVGAIKEIKIAKTSPSDRAWVFDVKSSNGHALIQGNAFRLAVGPDVFRSTMITEIKKSGKTFRFEGHGWGHGVGLCQWGARGRALAGHSYEKILDAYYPHVQLVKTGNGEIPQ
jgi:stage II sporulation protein D